MPSPETDLWSSPSSGLASHGAWPGLQGQQVWPLVPRALRHSSQAGPPPASWDGRQLLPGTHCGAAPIHVSPPGRRATLERQPALLSSSLCLLALGL